MNIYTAPHQENYSDIGAHEEPIETGRVGEELTRQIHWEWCNVEIVHWLQKNVFVLHVAFYNEYNQKSGIAKSQSYVKKIRKLQMQNNK